MFAPAGQTTARACLRSKLAALVVRRQAPKTMERDMKNDQHLRETVSDIIKNVKA